MLRRVMNWSHRNENFAFETNASTRSFVGLVSQVKEQGYAVI